MIEMVIDSIRVSMMNYHRVVLLKEKAGNRFLPIWIGPAEADAIAVKMRGVNVPRPLTHDLLRSVIDTLGAKVNFIIVYDLKNDVFYAKINLDVNGGRVEVDSRPSDALALAVRVEVPIYVEEVVMDKAGIYMNSEGEKAIPDEEEGESSTGKADKKEVTEDEIRRMSAFRDFIDNLDLEDFDKRKS